MDHNQGGFGQKIHVLPVAISYSLPFVTFWLLGKPLLNDITLAQLCYRGHEWKGHASLLRPVLLKRKWYSPLPPQPPPRVEEVAGVHMRVPPRTVDLGGQTIGLWDPAVSLLQEICFPVLTLKDLVIIVLYNWGQRTITYRHYCFLDEINWNIK